jgi:hypothetical protein
VYHLDLEVRHQRTARHRVRVSAQRRARRPPLLRSQQGSYKQHDFGFSAGGPVYIPKLYDGRNKTFFFGSMEWFRNRVGAASERFSVPTPEMYRGDFSNWVDAMGVAPLSPTPTPHES